MSQGKLTKVDLARIDLWTARDMQFVVKERGRYPTTIQRFTKCHKPRYTHRLKEMCLDRTDKWSRFFDQHEDGDRVICVVLEGQERFLWRSDVLTEAEYEAAREADRASLVSLL